MTLKHMRIFVAVFQEMNITRASNILHMTQPAVTRSIKEIENYYGVCLFERINHRLYRTESGNELYAYALHIIKSFEEMEKSIRNWDEFGVLRIGASITLGNFVLPPVISAFKQLHPNLRIKVTISNSANIQQAIMDSKIDLALIEGTVSSDYLFTEILLKDRMCLILPLSHQLCNKDKIYLKDLTDYPLLLRENGSAGRSFLNHVFALHGIDLEPLWESVSTQALVKAVSAGLGISVLPEQLVKQDIFSNLLTTRKVEDETFVRENYIVWHRQKFLTNAAKEFVAQCHKFVSQK